MQTITGSDLAPGIISDRDISQIVLYNQKLDWLPGELWNLINSLLLV